MRGKASLADTTGKGSGITPAYAGKSSNDLHNCCNCQDHPRLCGEKPNELFALWSTVGSPPPMRGKVKYTSCC